MVATEVTSWVECGESVVLVEYVEILSCSVVSVDESIRRWTGVEADVSGGEGASLMVWVVTDPACWAWFILVSVSGMMIRLDVVDCTRVVAVVGIALILDSGVPTAAIV